MRVRFWGTRGSLATPGEDTLRYGGNTSCVEVRSDDGHLLVLDAGTGIRPLGDAIDRGIRRVDILLSHLHARGLDLKRPLWEAYVIEGLSGVERLPGNSFAIMLKIHHAAIDGVSGAELVAAIHSLTDEVEPPPAEDDWQGERDPATWYVWSRAYLHNLKRPLKFFETVGSLVPAVIRANRTSGKRQGEQRKHRMARTRFNGLWVSRSE